MQKIIMLLIILVSLLVGCITWEEYNRNTPQALLEKQIGIMQYDTALGYWGEPISVFDGDEVFVVTWGSEKVGPVVTTAAPVGGAVIAATSQSRHGWKISATFNKKTRILATINRSEW
jgi:hypothetical protein